MPEGANADLAARAQDAFIWGLPLVLMERSFEVSANQGLPSNQFYITAELALPRYRQVGPNVDTLMGHAWLDLSTEPQIIGVPDAADRYYSIQLQDMYMDSFAYIGRRTTGAKAGFFAITPPGYSGTLPEGVTEIRAPTSRVLAYVRTMLRSPEDLPAALAVHSHYTLGPLSAFPGGRTTPIARSDRAKLFPHFDFTKGEAGVFDEIARLARAYPPLDGDAPNWARLSGADLAALPEAERIQAVKAAYAQIRSALKLTWKNGWARRDNVPPFIHDPLQRSANNFFGKGTHLSAEATYWGTYQGGMGDWLDGTQRYRMRFAPGQAPPVDAFWSLTLYDSDYVLFDNPINRYAILDRTEGLRYGADGALEIQIQADEPEEGASNWLPAPRGPFQLTVRAYQPKADIAEWRYTPPPAEIV